MTETLTDRMLDAMVKVADTSPSPRETFAATVAAASSLLAACAEPGRQADVVLQGARQIASIAAAIAQVVPPEPASPHPEAPISRSTH